MTITENTTVKLSSKICSAPAFPRLIQSKTVLYVLHRMIPELKQNPEAVGRFDMESLRRVLNYRNCAHLEMALRELEKYVINWEAAIPTGEKWGETYLFETFNVDTLDDLHVKINPALVNEIVNPQSYKTLNLKTLLSFRSNYALKLYLFCHRYLIEVENYGHTPRLTTDALRQLLACEDQDYPRNYDFIRNAVIRPLKEVCELGHLYVKLNHNKKHVYSRQYIFEISDKRFPGDPVYDEPDSEAEFTYVMSRLLQQIRKHTNTSEQKIGELAKVLSEYQPQLLF